MDQQRLDAKRMYKELTFGKKIEHIWFYYRRWIILPLLALMLIGYATYEVMSRPKYDLEGTFFSQNYISDEQVASLEEYLSQFVEDLNGDGVCNVKIHSYSVAMLGNEVEGSIVLNNKFSTEMAVGVDPFILVDSTFYEVLMQDAYEMAIEKPQELTKKEAFKEKVQIRDDMKVYWVTRALYTDEKDDPEAIEMHRFVTETEKKIFDNDKVK